MPISKYALQEYCVEELQILGGVIDYAEKMIYDEQQHYPYGALRRHAYAKSVVVDTEKKGTLIFRLSSTAAVYPNRISGYATPHSPVGRLCSFLRVGDESENELDNNPIKILL